MEHVDPDLLRRPEDGGDEGAWELVASKQGVDKRAGRVALWQLQGEPARITIASYSMTRLRSPSRSTFEVWAERMLRLANET